MKILQAGDKGKAICAHCQELVTTTYRHRDVPFSDGVGQASKILVGVCDTCDAIVSTPAQSTPAIKRARNNATESLETSLPAVYIDALDLACFKIDPDATTEMRKYVFLYYVHRFATGELDISRLHCSQKIMEAEYPAGAGIKKRLSFKITKAMQSEVDHLVNYCAMTRTTLAKSIVGEVKREILDEENVRAFEELRTIARVAM